MHARAPFNPPDLVSSLGSLECRHQPPYPVYGWLDPSASTVTVAAGAQQETKLRKNLRFRQPSCKAHAYCCVTQCLILSNALLHAARARRKRPDIATALSDPVDAHVFVGAQPQCLSCDLRKAVQHDLPDFANRIALLGLIFGGYFELCAADFGAWRYDVR